MTDHQRNTDINSDADPKGGMEREHREVSVLLGPAALGLLTAEEATRVQTHLSSCSRCRTDSKGLAPVVQALGRLSPQEALDRSLVLAPQVQDRVVQMVLQERSREQSRQQRFLRLCAGAAAAVVLIAGLSTATALSGQNEDRPQVLAVQAVQAQPGLDIDAGYIPHTWGIELTLTGSGFADGQAYLVEVTNSDGTTSPAGAFVGTGDRQLRCNLNASVLATDASSFTVRQADGQPVVTGQLA